MHVEEANGLLSQICMFNKIFFEEHLGIRWEQPDLKKITDSNFELLQGSELRLQASNIENEMTKDGESVKLKENWKMFQRIVETISESMGYLMDSDLPEVLALCGVTPEERKLAQLDNVFSVSFSRGLGKYSTLFSGLGKN